MLIKNALDAIGEVIIYLLNHINIPDMPDIIASKLMFIRAYMVSGLNIFSFFVDLSYFRVCCSFFLLLFSTHSAWRFIRWLMKKVPFLNVE